MKKKITALFLCVALAAIAIVGASLAYFTDTDNETNTFAVGNVKIDLIEQRAWREWPSALHAEQEAVPHRRLCTGREGYPNGYAHRQELRGQDGHRPEHRLRDAYIRAYFAIPADLDDGYETFNAGMNVLHFNFGNKIVDGNITPLRA